MAVRIRGSIGATIFGAFVAMSIITGTLGVLGVYVLSLAGGFVAQTYDGPLMAVNYARSASLDFSQMDKEFLRRQRAPQGEQEEIDERLAQLTVTFFEDLGIAEERSLADDERIVIAEIRQLVTEWDTLRRLSGSTGAAYLNTLSAQVIQRFDLLTELTVGHTFVARRKAVSAMADFETLSIAAIVLALLLSAGITFLLARRIVAPLSAAAAVADRIAGGEFETSIPAGGGDETGKLLRSMAVMQDSVRVMMEREKAGRQSAQDRLIAALEGSHDAMVLIDAGGRVVTANSQLTAFFPPLARQINGAENFAAVFKEVAERLVTRIVVPGSGREPDWSDLLAQGGEFQLADGRWLRASRSSTPDGGFFLVLSDFTDIKEREARLQEAKQQAEAASAAKSNFLANMSHELRTPLNAIIGFADIIAGQLLGNTDNPKYRDYATDIVRSGRHLLDVISSVLDVAKSQAGKLQLNHELIDLRHIFDDCVAMMREQCRRAQLELAVQRPDDVLLVWADPAKLRQIILNLLSNSVKFTEAGGVISMVASPPADGVVDIRISDTGIGMSPEHIAIALTPFSQVDNRLARRYEGTGLGLPLTKALIELHGSEMTIVSKLGVGTEVAFSLKQRPDDDGAEQSPAPGAAARTG